MMAVSTAVAMAVSIAMGSVTGARAAICGTSSVSADLLP